MYCSHISLMNKMCNFFLPIFHHLVVVGQWCTTSGPRATSGPRRVLMWPATSGKKIDYFRAVYRESQKYSTANQLIQLTIIFHLASLGLSSRCPLWSYREKYRY